MLVAADGVEAAVGRVLHLVHEVVVHVVGALRVEQRGMDVDPHRGMLLAEVVRQLGVRHQVEPHQLHGVCSLGGAVSSGWRHVSAARSLTGRVGHVSGRRKCGGRWSCHDADGGADVLELGEVGVDVSGSPQDDHRAGKPFQRREMARTLIVLVVPDVFQELPIETLDATGGHVASRAAEVANTSGGARVSGRASAACRRRKPYPRAAAGGPGCRRTGRP